MVSVNIATSLHLLSTCTVLWLPQMCKKNSPTGSGVVVKTLVPNGLVC